jgi:hypothetical protein
VNVYQRVIWVCSNINGDRTDGPIGDHQDHQDWCGGWRFMTTRPGKLTFNYRKSLFLIGKSTISMVIFQSYFDITRGYTYLWCQWRIHPLSSFNSFLRKMAHVVTYDLHGSNKPHLTIFWDFSGLSHGYLKPKQHVSGLYIHVHPILSQWGKASKVPTGLGRPTVAKRQDRPDYVMLRKLFADLRAGMPKRCVILGSLELWEYQNTIRMTYEYTKNDILMEL